jgi:arylsulfatase A-like enzyme
MRIIIAILWFIFAAGEVCAKPNIVVIMTDDQDTGSVAFMPKTLSLIADHGVTFKYSFVNLPLCAPSRASFLTGQAARNHGIKADSPLDAGGWQALKSKEGNALPVWLQVAGYKTALIGKYVNGYGSPREWVPPGWNLWYAFSESGPKYYNYSINVNGKTLHFGRAPADYSTDVLKQRAVQFIRDQSANSGPFFLYVCPKAAHAQGAKPIPSPQYQELFKKIPLPKSPAYKE